MSVHGLPTPPPEPYVTGPELAEIMHVSIRTIYRLREEGMPSVSWGLRTRRYLPSVAIAWANARENGKIAA